MTVTQLSIPIANKPGELSRISEMMGDSGVNILALFVTTVTGEGLMRFVADNPEKAKHVLTSHGMTVTTQEVIAAETPITPAACWPCSTRSSARPSTCSSSIPLSRPASPPSWCWAAATRTRTPSRP